MLFTVTLATQLAYRLTFLCLLSVQFLKKENLLLHTFVAKELGALSLSRPLERFWTASDTTVTSTGYCLWFTISRNAPHPTGESYTERRFAHPPIYSRSHHETGWSNTDIVSTPCVVRHQLATWQRIICINKYEVFGVG